MCCLFTVLVVLGPRAVILLWSLADPARWALTFPEFIWSFLGFLFLPWVTLMYVIVFPGGIEGFDWVWLGLALLADIASYSGGAYGNRNSIPGYSSGE
ncbi:MAG: hypothetical protein U0452_11255 [Anaerolineae bacterium]